MINFLKSLLQSFKTAFASNEDVQKLERKYPRARSFLKSRLSRTKFTGLPLTILAIVFIYVLLLFFGAVGDFITSDIIVQADARVNTLLYVFRNASAVKAFIWITLSGESPVIIVFALLVSLLLFLARQKRQIIMLWFTIIGSEGFTFILKMVFHRPRPLHAVFLEDSNSFPSGHATIAVAFYGFLIYLLLRDVKNKSHRVLVIVAGVIVMLAIGFSRLYLGVHYASDVLAGYLVGLLWLIIGARLNERRTLQQC